MGATDRLRRGLAQAEVLHLAFGDERADRFGDVLDRHFRIDAVLVEDVDVVGVQVPQAVLGDLTDVLRATVVAAVWGRSAHVESELGADHDLVAERLDGLADQLLAGAGPHAVELGGIEERHARLVGAADRGDRVGLAARVPVGHGHAHRSEPDRRDLETL